MPRRTNDFQKLVLLLQHQLAGPECVITESDMVESLSGGVPREVDVTIRFSHGPVSIVTGIEATDRQRPSDSSWVEQMIGKHRDLATDKLVLYSSSGFTENAHHVAKISNVVLVKRRDIEAGAATDRISAAALGNIYIESTFYSVLGRRPWFEARTPDGNLRIDSETGFSGRALLDPSGRPIGDRKMKDLYEALIEIHRKQIFRDFGPEPEETERILRLRFQPPLITPAGAMGAIEPHIRFSDPTTGSRIYKLWAITLEVKIAAVKKAGYATSHDFDGVIIAHWKTAVGNEEFTFVFGGTRDDPITTALTPQGKVTTFRGRGSASPPVDSGPSGG